MHSPPAPRGERRLCSPPCPTYGAPLRRQLRAGDSSGYRHAHKRTWRHPLEIPQAPAPCRTALSAVEGTTWPQVPRDHVRQELKLGADDRVSDNLTPLWCAVLTFLAGLQCVLEVAPIYLSAKRDE